MLEDHSGLVPAQLDDLLHVVLQDVLTIDLNYALCGFDQPDETADQSGFAASGQTHDHKNFPDVDVERNVADGNDVTGLFLHLLPRSGLRPATVLL